MDKKSSDFGFELRELKTGLKVSWISGRSSDTASGVRTYLPLLDKEVNQANAIVRANPDITVSELRNELPYLSLRASDTRLIELIDSGGSVSSKDFATSLLADAAGDLSEDTINWYRTHQPRQKYPKRGRPKK